MTHPNPRDYPHLAYFIEDDGVHYFCFNCKFDRNLGFTGNTSDVIRARDEHSATACARRELPTGVDQVDLDETAELRRQIRQQLQDAEEAARNQPSHTKRWIPAIEEELR
jgi:hypothetical protein